MTRTAACTALLLAALTSIACTREAPKAEAPRPVLTEVVGAATATDGAVVLAGEVRSRTEQLVAFRVGGKLVERRVDAGARVAANDILARLDPADTRLAAEAADAQQRLADAELKRYRELRERNFVSAAALDARTTTLAASRAQAELARNQAAYTVLRADQPGVVGQVLAEVGQVVAAGQPVLRIARLDQSEVAVGIPENLLPAVQAAGKIRIELWSAAGKSYPGHVREIAAVADPATRTYAARVAFDVIDPAIAIGMSATVRLDADSATRRIRIPQSALFQQGAQPAVWLVAADATVSLRPVVVARYTAESVELSSGLADGERIVVAGVHKLNVGDHIRVAERGPAGPTLVSDRR